MKKQFQSKSVPRGTRTIWRYLGALFILFTFAIGNVWAALPLTAMPEGTNLLTSASGALTTWATGTKNQVIYDDNNYFMAWSNGNNLEIDGTGFKIGNSKKKSALVFYIANPSDISVGIARNGSDMTASLHYMGTSMSVLTDPNNDSDGGGTKCDELAISASATSGTLTKTSGAAGYYKVFGTLRFYATSITITETSGGDDPEPEDTTAPTLASSVPANSATNVDVAGNIVLTMSENVTIADASKFSISGGAGSLTTASIAASGKNVTIPYTGLANSTAYTLTVAKGALKDAAENENEAFTVAFTTAAPLAEPDYVLVRNNGTLNTDDFITGGTFENNKSWKVGDVTYTSGLKFTNASSSLQFNDAGRFVAYNTKTDATHIDIAVYNTNSSSTKVKVAIIKENADGSLTVVQDAQYDLAARSGSSPNYVYGYWTGSFDLTGRSIMYVYEPSNSGRIRICQMAVYETGSNNNLAAPAIDYSINLNKGRMFAAATTATTFEGLTYSLYSRYMPNNSTSAAIRNKGTEYISFTIPAGQARQLQVKASGSYNVSKTKGDESSYVSGNQNFNLTEGTWYINPNGSNVTITGIAFATAPTAYTVTYSKGDGSVKEGKTIPTQAATIEGGKFNVASGENLEKEGYDFAGWKYTPAVGDPVIYNAGQEFTMPATAVEFVAQWQLHVAKYGVKFMDGATKLDSLSVTLGQAPVFANPTKALYSFAGWKDGEDNDVTLSDLATSVTVEDTKLVLYAQWTKLYAQSVDFTEFLLADERLNKSLAQVFTENSLNYVCGGTFSNSEWGKTNGEDAQYQGYKFKDKNVYVEFRVEANKRVTLLFGSYNAIGTIKVGDAEAVDCSLTDSKYVIDTDVEQLIRFTTNKNSGSTVTLKSITVGEIPALSDDATLSDLKVGGTTISGFSPSVTSYYVEMPYGTAKADLPLVTVTTNEEHAVATVQDAKDRPDDTRATIHVVAQNGTSDKYYYVYFTIAPKYGVELIKATHNGTANGATVTGYIGGTVDKLTQNNGKLGSGAQSGDDPHHYFGIQLAEGTFKAGDMLVIKASALNGGNAATLYSDKGNTEIKIDGQFDTNSKMYVYTLEADVEKIYLYRQTSGCNPNVEYMAVYRLVAPFIEEFKIGEAVGTINKSAKTIAVEVPYSADLEHLTPAVKYWANGTAQISPAIGVTDFTDPVVFTVSSGYAEDATGAYAPVPYTVTVTKEAHYEAKIGETGYATLVAAVEAAQDGDVIVLQEDVTNGAGVMLTKTDAKEITIDFGGYTYTAVSPAVGSAGTQNQAFHLEKGNTVTLKNGTITSSGSEIKMLIQNYCDLTLENIVLDGSGLEGSHRYVLSNNCGDVVIGSGTEITAKPGDVAFDVCATNYYPEGVTVTVKDGATISGIVEYDVWGTKPADNHAELAIEGGNFDVTWNVEAALAEDAKDNLNVSGGTFTAAVPADYCAEGYAPTSWTVGTETKYGVHLAGVIRGAASTNSDGVYYYTLDNDVTIFSSESDGRLKASNHIATSSDIEPCGGDKGGYNVNQSKFVLKFPVNVKEFTLYGANSTERTISKVYVNAEASKDIKISNVGRELTGTYSNTKDGKCQTLTAVYAGENVIAANDYVLVTLSGTANIYRILYTEAECTDPVINSTDATRMKVGETATVSVDASAVGATYQWYRCEDALGANPQIITNATAASYSFTKVAGDEYFKVVVGNNCNDVKVEAIVKAEEWFEVTRTNVTGYTEWNWNDVADTDDGIQIAEAQKGLVLASYLNAPNFDKLEGINNAYVYRNNSYPAYQGSSLKFTTEVAGLLTMTVRSSGSGQRLFVNGVEITTEDLTSTPTPYNVVVKAGDVTITSGGNIRIYAMTFDPNLSPEDADASTLGGYERDVTEGRYGTICLENGGVMVGATLYEVAYYGETSKKIFFDEILNGEMEAGVPYIYLPNENATQLGVFYTDAAGENAQSANGLVGYIGESEATEHALPVPVGSYILNNNQYREVVYANSAYILSHRAYINLSAINPTEPALVPGRRRISMSVQSEQVVTDIDNLNAAEQPVKLLINGQIFILRGEKMYDATGRLVK